MSSVQETYLKGIADALREVTGETGVIPAVEFAERIRQLTYIKPGMLLPTNNWYKGSTARSAITKINIVDTYTITGSESESWDASVDQDGSIKCYITGTELTIAGNSAKKIYANPQSSYCFSYFSALTSINGLNLIDTRNATNMMSMFAGSSKLAALDLSSFDTSNVNYMNAMFRSACRTFASLDLKF